MKLKRAEIGEALSLGISFLIVGSVLFYLIAAIFHRTDQPYIAIEASAQNAVSLPEGGYIVPVSIRNMGEKTVSYALVTLTLPTGEKKEMEIQYLPRQSTRKTFIFVNEAYENDQIDFEPTYYRLD